jgi:hypothetical protein
MSTDFPDRVKTTLEEEMLDEEQGVVHDRGFAGAKSYG